MKKRKVLFLLPVAALILSGCTFQEGWETVKGWTGSNIYEPVKNWVMKLLGQEEQKKEDKKDEEKGGGDQGGGDQGGGGEQETTKYGTLENPLTIAQAKEIIEEECLGDGDLTKQAIYCYGEIKTVYSTHDYDTGPAFELDVKDDEAEVYVYRVHGKEEDKANCKVGSIIHFHGFAKNYSGTLEFCDNGKNQCTVDSLAKPQGTEAVTGIEFDNPAYEVQVGKTINVTASVLPLNAGNQNYTLSLKDLSPAGCVELLEGNKLKGIAVGSAKVVATSQEGNFTAEATVTINAAINYGSLENPLTIEEAMAVINKENPTKEKVYVTGTVKSNKAYNTQYNNTEIWITDGTNDFELYGCSLPENFTPAQPVENDPALVGKEVVAHGTAKKYNSTYELDKGCSIDSVSEPVQINVEEVTLSPKSLALEVGAEETLTATVTPSNAKQTVNWTVEQEGTIVEVTNGVVKAKAAGTAVVKATSTEDETKFDTATVTVSEATKVYVESIVANPKSVLTEVGADPVEIEIQVTPSQVEETIDWVITEGEDVISLSDDNKVTGLKAGEATIEIKGHESHVGTTVSVKVTPALTSIQDVYNDALDSKKGPYTFQGVVTAIQGTSFYLQDNGYGMLVYAYAVEDIAVGKIVRVTGEVTVYKGLAETAQNKVTEGFVVGDGTLPEPLNITSYSDIGVANILAKADNAVFKSKNGTWSGGSSGNAPLVEFTIGGTDISVKFDKYGYDAEKAALVNNAVAGDKFNLGNIVTSINESTKQLGFAGTSTIEKVEINPESIQITSAASVKVGATLKLTASTSPAGAPHEYSWSIVSGDTFASLDGDTLTGVATGTVRVRATLVGYPSITAEQDIEVEAADPAPTKSWQKITEQPTTTGEYKLVLDRETNADNPGLWFVKDQTQKESGGKNDYYIMTSANAEDGADITLTVVEGGFKLKIGARYLWIGEVVNGTKTYTNSLLKDSADDASVLTYDLTNGFGVTISEKFWGLGTRNDQGNTYVGATNFTQYPANYKACLYEYKDIPSGGGEGGGGGTPDPTPGEGVTVSATMSEIATANNWTTSTNGSEVCYASFNLDNNITVSTTGDPNCGSYWGSDWRLYHAKNGNLIITAASGYQISELTVTFSNSKNGTLMDGETAISSGAKITINASSKTFVVEGGDNSTQSNGQIRITAISVTYVAQ